ncbi:MAG: hypothetical protein IJW51_06285 [Clostridia bacterium]|nr:hypothetical protein [Clostridia bacterium]
MQFPKNIFSGYHGQIHCQGIAVDAKKGYIYYSFTTKLIKADLLGNVIGSVDGLIGHLGCIDFCEQDGKVYGSLEYKNDIIGKIILKSLHMADVEIKNAFYCVIFDVDKIDRMNMNAETDGIMRAVYLPQVAEDFEACVTVKGARLPHKYACSGIDGIGWGPAWGQSAGREYLRICYGVYGDVDRCDNDYQVILTFDAARWWDTVARPLRQGEMHRCGDGSASKCFVCTGSTTFGVQNLEYDAYKKQWMLAVYRGKKPGLPNYDMFFISADAMPRPAVHTVYGEEISELPLSRRGIYFPYGATGMYAFGDGRYYFSRAGQHEQLGQYTNAVLYRATSEDEAPFAEVT